jgi:hypothetical protein
MKRRSLGNQSGGRNRATLPWRPQWSDTALETVKAAAMERRSLRNYACGRNETTQHEHVIRATAWERYSPRI